MLRLFRRAVDVRPNELAALLLAFAFHFVVLAGYYVIRPIRDEIGACDQTLKSIGDHITVEEKLEAMKAIAALRRQEEAELTAISDKLDSLRGHQARHWQTVGKMITDLAKLKQTDAHFSARLAFDKQEADGLSAAERAVIEAVPHKEDEG